jgi:hypothetical protein
MKKSLPNKTTADPEATNPQDSSEHAERRAALAKLGKMAAWTAPTLLTLLATTRPAAAS